MKYLFTLFMLMCLSWNISQAQNGTAIYDAIPIETNLCGTSTFTDYKYTPNFTHNYGNPGPDVWYTFTLTEALSVNISLCGSDYDTYVWLLDENGSTIANDDDGGCGNATSEITQSLNPGTYYVVAEGYSSYSGNLTINFVFSGGGPPVAGRNISSAINAGNYTISGSYTDTKSNVDNCLGNDIGQVSNDIYYQFTLTGTSVVTLSHCGSGFDTYMHLLDATGNVLLTNDDNIGPVCSGLESSIVTTLPAGIYYVVSEGYGPNTGNIVTSIDVVVSPPLAPPAITYSTPLSFNAGNTISPLLPVNTGGVVSSAEQTTVTYAGSGLTGSNNGTALSASFNNPLNAVVDASGNVYIADAGNHSIRKITPSGVVSTFAGAGYAGYADGTGTAARFKHPSFLAIDASGNLYVSDQQNHRIRKITPSGVVTTFAGNGSIGATDGNGASASFNYPMGLTFDRYGNLYVADAYNHKIRKIIPTGVVSTYAGAGVLGNTDGSWTSARFNHPMGLAFDAAGNLFVADRQNYLVRKVAISGVVNTFAGSMGGYQDGTGTAAMFNTANNLVIDAEDNIYVADQNNNMIRKITPLGVVSTFAGIQSPGTVNGEGNVVRFNSPFGIAKGSNGAMYVVENAANLIRKMVLMKPYTISPALPPGLVFNEADGSISGKPTVLWPATTYTVIATNSAGTSTTTLSIEVTLDSPPNNDKNWVHTKSYDEDGNLIGESKVYMDNNGKTLQTQVKSLTTGQVLASEQINDALGRPVINTLIAPIDASGFGYKENFVQNDLGEKYNYNNFDLNKTNNPSPVGNSAKGTLGWYYSENNSSEPYVGATGFPYARTDFYSDGSGASKRSAGIGEQMRMGSGHESRGITVPVVNELDFYKQVRDKFFSQAVIGERDTLINKAVQNIVTDQNGTQAISVADLSGNLLMSARPAGNSISQLTVNNSISLSNKTGYQFEINGGAYAGGYIKDILVKGEGDISVYESQDNGQSYQLAYNGSAVNYPGTTGSSRYRIESPVNFEVSYNAVPASGPQFVVCDRCQATVSSFGKKQIHYFQLLQDGVVTVNGTNVRLYNMGGDEQEISFTSGQVLSKGFYKAAITLDGDATISYSNNYADLSYSFYNHLGQLVATIAPEGVNKLLTLGLNSFSTIDDVPFVNRNEYDLQGRLIATTQTDAGRTEFIYRTDGNVRFSQNAEQRKNGRFSYVNYDRWGRSFESGEYLPGDISFTSAKTDVVLQETIAVDGGLTGGSRLSKVTTHYDRVNNDHGQAGYVQDEDFLGNTVSWTENENSKTWYNYDGQGRISWIIKSINGLGIKTIDYTYDAAGNTVSVDYQRNDALERFIHEYEYDEDNRLKVAYTSTDPLLGRKEQARYYYSMHGSLKRVELAENLQGIDYTYTVDGAIKAINHSDSSKDPGKDGINNGFAPDAFGMTLEYFDGDYNRATTGIGSIGLSGNTTYYNGMLSGQSWRSLKPNSIVSAYGSGVNNTALITYAYDENYQFDSNKYKVSDNGNNSFTEVPNANREHSLSYDANGNIKTLSRTNASGINTANFSYTYQNNSNKLTSVSDYATYSYDDLGQMTQQAHFNGQSNYIDYDVNGMVLAIYSDAAKTQLRISFGYNEAGLRIRKTDHVLNVVSYYVHDASGNVLAIYDNKGTVLQQKDIPLYAASRIGTYNRIGNDYQYELSDHLGNVRVVFSDTKLINGDVDVVYYSDYYPFGTALTLQGNNDYRYGYQGQYAEVDKETGWNNFELRMYDPAIGRWMRTDPYMQYASPYVGMGNNPISLSDPDGGETSGPGDPPVDILGGTLKGINVIGKRIGNAFSNWWNSAASAHWSNVAASSDMAMFGRMDYPYTKG